MNKQIFEDFKLNNEILKAIHFLGFETPTDVQNKVIPLAMNGKDLVVKAQTGSGKTASFGIPLCDKILVEEKLPQALILTPTRELCVQIKEDISNIGRFKKVRCIAVYGKQPVSIQINELKQRVNIITGTPGRTLDLINRGHFDVSKIKYLIIDEADKMLAMGFIDQITSVVERLPKTRVTMLFSATLPPEIEEVCSRYMYNPIRIEITSLENAPTIKQSWYETSVNLKFDLLEKIIYTEVPSSCIIFCRTKENVDLLFKQLKDRRFSCNALHGGMIQKDRLEIMQSFKRGEFRFLVATDVAARGIDIEELSHIINYDIPLEKESYVHRIGRTGRAGSNGNAITFVTPQEISFLEGIEEYVGYRISKAEPPKDTEVENGKKTYNKQPSLELKADKSSLFDKEIFKLYINAGKSKKIRTADIVGAINSITGVSIEDIGIIDIQDNLSYIDILNGKGEIVLEALQRKKVKGKTVRAQKAEK